MLHYYMQLLVFISLDYDYMYDLYIYITYICMLRKVIRLCIWYDLSIRQVALEARKSLKIAKASIWQSKFRVLCHAWNQKMLLVKQRECWQFLTGEALPQFRIWSSRASKARSFRVEHNTWCLILIVLLLCNHISCLCSCIEKPSSETCTSRESS